MMNTASFQQKDQEEVSTSETASNVDTVMTTTAAPRYTLPSISKVQLFTLLVSIVALGLSSWSLILTRGSDEDFQAVYTPIEDTASEVQLNALDDVGQEEDDHNGRDLFEDSRSLGCYNSCGTTYCKDAPYTTVGTLSPTGSRCLPFSSYTRYIRNTLVQKIRLEHIQWGKNSWASHDLAAQCTSLAVDYELYDIVGSYSCISSAKFAVVTQLSCSAFTGRGSCGGGSGSGGGGGSGGSGGGGIAASTMCMTYCICRSRKLTGGFDPDECNNSYDAQECGCPY